MPTTDLFDLSGRVAVVTSSIEVNQVVQQRVDRSSASDEARRRLLLGMLGSRTSAW
jgi:hypothetical protein